MNSIYDSIVNYFAQYLSEDFILEYNNNTDFDWSEVLKENVDKNIYGVLRADNGTTQFIGDQSIELNQMHISFAIPSDKNFKESVAYIDDLRTTLNGVIINVDERRFGKILFDGRTDGVIERVNGKDWIMTELHFQFQVFKSIYTSDDRSVKVDTVALKGILKTTYDFNVSLESVIQGFSNKKPTNYPNSYQRQLIVDLVMSSDNTKVSSIMTNEQSLSTYSVEYKGAITRTMTMICTRINELVVTGDIYTVQLTFVEKG